MSLVIALALLIAFTWFIGHRDGGGDEDRTTLTSPRPAPAVVRRAGDERS
jgi:hypothetical protein